MSLRFSEHPVFDLLRQSLPADTEMYLVGGAVRDFLMNRPCVDFDFVMGERPLHYARKIADKLKGAFYPLDEIRQTGRVLWVDDQGKRIKLDFALLRSSTLEGDLRLRDFTANAIAVDIRHPDRLIDPTGGAKDILHKTLRQCSGKSFQDDPLRILRGVRLAVTLGFRIEPQSWHAMQQAVTLLPSVSAERMRDEVFHIMMGSKVAAGIRLLDRLGALALVFPELLPLKGLEQSPPHRLDGYQHTLDVVQKLEDLLMVLSQPPDEQAWQANLISGMASHKLGRYREKITGYLKEEPVIDRPRRGLLMLAALYHDTGKPGTRTLDDEGRIRFFRHEELSRKLAVTRLQDLNFARSEVDEVATMIAHHMRPILLAADAHQPSARSIYRFYRDAGSAGVGTAILSLADILGVYGYTITAPLWQNHLDVVRQLLEAWWERSQEAVHPPPLINGNELMEELGLTPGPQIGRILDAVREGQVSGEITSREDALSLARQLVSQG